MKLAAVRLTAGATDATEHHRAEGTVYLLHFSERVGNGGHYLGWAKDLESRLSAHRAGRGGRATRVLAGRGGSFVLARTWPGGLALEAKLRRQGPKRLCPICGGRASLPDAAAAPEPG